MKRQIKREYSDSGSRIQSIFDQLKKLGFYGEFSGYSEDAINLVLDKLHETEEALARAQNERAVLQTELALLKKRYATQFDTISKFQGLTGVSYPEGVYKSGSQYVKDRRSKERRGTSTWLIDNSILEAIKALGSVSPRTNAQTEALKLLISSVRMDGSTQFRTPGHDRRVK